MNRTRFAALVVTVLFAAPAGATDFTFDVPVAIRNVPLLTSVDVRCFVSVLPAGTTGTTSPTNLVGDGIVTVDTPGGTFEGTVTVPVENHSVLRSADARSYQCDLYGHGVSPSGSPVALGGSWSTDLQRMTGVGLTSETLWTEANFH